MERLPTDGGNRVAHRYARKVTATFECRIADARDTIGDRYARKAGAITERRIADDGDRVAYRYARKIGAMCERIIADSGNRVGNYKICVILTNRIRDQHCSIFRIKISVNGLICCIIFIHNNARKVAAITERIIADGGGRVGDRYARKVGAITERIISDGSD